MSFCETQLSDEAQLLHRFQGNQNAVKVHCCYLPRKCWRSRYPTETA